MSTKMILFLTYTALLCLRFASLVQAAAIPGPSQVEIREVSPDQIPLRLRTAKNPAFDVLAYKLPEVSSRISVTDQHRRLGVYICRDPFFSGRCFHFFTSPHTCIQLDPEINDQASSIGPDDNAVCLFSMVYHSFGGCREGRQNSFVISTPGVPDLREWGYPENGIWNKDISSYRCQ
ncbi:hypothetical protein BJ508DRAFT_300855 [Ascobolus immersus RN42]|uniref:Ubiquitin 3 binding protein But2 C-terminal domain-containing protein n=1 Tax=Ascobolus immersus RN42 TaxID=1160509 RepID=A0A3N4IPE6_ASCIM|nr:hypothetical protein BJ508DRAFT_300855 [Ascobolus immersus RN42]